MTFDTNIMISCGVVVVLEWAVKKASLIVGSVFVDELFDFRLIWLDIE